MSARRPGIALIEAIVGLTILATVVGAWLVLASQSSATLARMIERETQVSGAGQILARHAALSHAALAQAAGRRRSGAAIVRISELRPGLFEVEVVPDDRSIPPLRTMLYKPADGVAPDAR